MHSDQIVETVKGPQNCHAFRSFNIQVLCEEKEAIFNVEIVLSSSTHQNEPVQLGVVRLNFVIAVCLYRAWLGLLAC